MRSSYGLYINYTRLNTECALQYQTSLHISDTQYVHERPDSYDGMNPLESMICENSPSSQRCSWMSECVSTKRR